LVVALTALTANASAAIITWSIEDGGNGHAYEFVDQHLTWVEAKIAAEQRTHLGVSGHLVTITSAAENEFVFENVLPADAFDEGAWIGLTDDEVFGGFESFGQLNPQIDGWVWVTGETVSYTAWNPVTLEPNNSGNEDYAVMHVFRGNVWNDQTSFYTPRFIVEYDLAAVPEPATLVIWSVAGALGCCWWQTEKGGQVSAGRIESTAVAARV
jgi:hypothetical protein